MNNKNIAILMVVVAVVSAGLTRYFFPQVEYKNTETVKEVVRNDVHTVVKEVVLPDGTKETTTETTDKSVKKDTATSETEIAAKKQWMFSVGTSTKLSDRDFISYDIQVQRRILGPFYLGAKASTDQSVGVSIGMEF